jgi:AAA15 family ATPase/GTPase
MSEATANKLVKVYLKIREKRAELSKQDSELEEQQEIIEAELLNICKETGADGLRTQFGTVSRSVKKRFWTSDWSSFYDFVKEHNALELLEKRVAQSNMATFIEENPDLVPPGLQVDSRYTAVIRRK